MWGGEVVLSISKIDGKERQPGSVATAQGEKQSGPSEKHPQNNLYQNSFCQQILWRETPFRQKNLLMHFRAHNNSTCSSSSTADQQTTWNNIQTHAQCYACYVFFCLRLFPTWW